MAGEAISGKKELAGFSVRLVCFSLLLCAVMVYGVYVLTPKEDYGICPMTNLYVQPRDTVDMLVIGTSLAYSGCNTNVLWRDFGIAGYALGGAEQPFWETYYLLREAMTLQRLRLIVLDAKAACYVKDYSSRARTIQHTFGILNPFRRIEAIFGCQEDPREALDFVLAYPQVHNRYANVTREDFSWPPSNQGRGTAWKGYIETDMVEPHLRPGGPASVLKSLGHRSEEYVRKIFELARAEGIPVIAVAFPSPDYGSDAAYFASLWAVAEEYGVPYIDYNDPDRNVGLDYAMDFADWQHLNVRGSIKMARRLGKDLRALFDLPDRRGDPAYESYNVCADTWYGKLNSFFSAPR